VTVSRHNRDRRRGPQGSPGGKPSEPDAADIRGLLELYGKHAFDAARLEKAVRDHAAIVTNQLAATADTGLHPSLHVYLLSPGESEVTLSVFVLAVPFDTPEEKELLYKLGRGCYEQMRLPVAATLASTAWTLQVERDAPAPADLSTHPDRKEVLVAFGGTLQGQHTGVLEAPAERTPDGHLKAGPWGEYSPGVEVGLLGRFFHGFFSEPEHRRRTGARGYG
jgi:hypothetical protein